MSGTQRLERLRLRDEGDPVISYDGSMFGVYKL